MKQEQRLQQNFSTWLSMKGVLFCASAGGMRTNIRTAINMKRAGYKKGFPDIQILEPRGQFHGMFIEIKCGTYPTNEQKEWREELTKRGYFAVIVPANLDFFEAQKWIEEETEKYLVLEVE